MHREAQINSPKKDSSLENKNLSKDEGLLKRNKAYKFEKRVIIILQSNNLPDLNRIAYKYYFSARTTKKENDPEDRNKYVAISVIPEPTREAV